MVSTPPFVPDSCPISVGCAVWVRELPRSMVSWGEKDLYDCIVVGAGPAGLSASLFLARYRRRTLTFHHNSPRNEYAHGVHGFLGHHGISPAELLARGRDEVTTHGGLIVEACVSSVEKISPEHFRVSAGPEGSEQHVFEARRLL